MCVCLSASSIKVSNLFARDEIDEILSDLIPPMKREFPRRPPTNENLYEFFMSRVRQHLHVVLCFSPVGAAFRQRASRFPSLINCAVIDWFQPWPETALYDVAKRFLNDTELGTPENKETIIKFMPFSFGAVNKASDDYREKEKRYNYTTPKSFLELIYLYKNMLSQNRAKLEGNINRLGTGLDKLEATAKDVAVLVDQVKIKSAEVEIAKTKADEVAEVVGAEKDKVGIAAAIGVAES